MSVDVVPAPAPAGAGPVPAPQPYRHDPAPAAPAGGGLREGRLPGIDAARGLALFGMIAVHSLVATDAAGGPSLSWQLAAGHAAALFAVLAGTGVAFVTGRRRVALRRLGPPAAGLVARGLVVGVIGLLVGSGADPTIATVILPYYAVLFVLAVPLVVLGTRTLLVVAVAAAAGIPFASHALRAGLPPASGDNLTLTDLVGEPGRVLVELTLTGTYPALAWIAYLALGLAIGRMRLSSARTATWLAVVGGVTAVLAKVVSAVLLGPLGGLATLQADAAAHAIPAASFDEWMRFGPDGVTPPTSRWWLALGTSHASTPPDLFHTMGTSMLVIGVMLLLGRVAATSTVCAPLAAAGSMTLTFYVAHVLFIESPYDDYSPVAGYLIQVVAAVLIGLAWRATAGRGPFERLVAAVSRRASSLVRSARRLVPATVSGS